MKRLASSSESPLLHSPRGVTRDAVLIIQQRRLTVVCQVWMLLKGSDGGSFHAGVGNLCREALQSSPWVLHVLEWWRLLLLMELLWAPRLRSLISFLQQTSRTLLASPLVCLCFCFLPGKCPLFWAPSPFKWCTSPRKGLFLHTMAMHGALHHRALNLPRKRKPQAA